MDSWHKPSHLGRRLVLRSHILGRHRTRDSRRQGRSCTPGTRTLGTPGRTRTCRVQHGRAVQDGGAGAVQGAGEDVDGGVGEDAGGGGLQASAWPSAWA